MRIIMAKKKRKERLLEPLKPSEAINIAQGFN